MVQDIGSEAAERDRTGWSNVGAAERPLRPRKAIHGPRFHRPVADPDRTLTLNVEVERHIVVEPVRVVEVLEQGGVVVVLLDLERLEGRGGDNPGRDGGAEVLAQERAKRHIFPRLDVARRPVVEEDVAENVLAGLFGGQAISELGCFAAKNLGVRKLGQNNLGKMGSLTKPISSS